MDRIPDPGSPLEDAGVPALQDASPGQRIAGDPYEEVDVTHDRPLAAEAYGTTAREQRDGETLEQRLAHEEPDVGVDEPLHPDAGSAGRLVEPDEGAHGDVEKDAVARSLGADAGGLSAEEAAVRVLDEPAE